MNIKKIIAISIITHTLLFGFSITPTQAAPALKNGVNQYVTGNFKRSVAQIYQANGYKLMWAGDENIQKLSNLTAAFDDTMFNYSYKDFKTNEIMNLSAEIDSGVYQGAELVNMMAKLDVMATSSYIKLIYFIRKGDVDWALVKRKLKNLKDSQDVHAAWEIHPRGMPSAASIVNSVKKGDIDGYLKSLLPLREQYESLINILNQYQSMPNTNQIPYGVVIRPEMNDDRIRQIKTMLISTGDLPQGSKLNNEYTPDLSAAISSFRSRFNLKAGDYIDNTVIKYLNTGKNKYVSRIITNLEMLKVYPNHFESNHILVNIPEYKLRYYKNGNEVMESEVVVGRIDRPTPIFKGKIKYLVLNPTWTITDNLVRRDLIPVLKENPNYLKEHDIHVFTSYKKDAKEVPLDFNKLKKYEHSKKAIPYRFVQFPGDNNALGRVKFMFPNKYTVYLHDTDNKTLFDYRYRPYSSGCVRVKYPFELMNNILSDAGSNYTGSKAQSIINSGIKTTYVKLKKSVPIHMIYQTVRDVNGQTKFFFDVYMYEQIVWESMGNHKQSTFVVPEQRLTTVKRGASRISN